MPTFVVEEKDRPAPARLEEPLPHLSDGTAVNQYYFRSKTDTVRDVCKPGRFNFMRDSFRSGAHKGVVHLVKAMLGNEWGDDPRLQDMFTRWGADAGANLGYGLAFASAYPDVLAVFETWGWIASVRGNQPIVGGAQRTA